MGRPKRVEHEESEPWMAFVLAWVAGFVDAVGFVALLHLFTAHMSGNSVAMGAELGRGHLHEATHRALPIPAFVAGVGVGAALGEWCARRGVRSRYAPVLALEAALLVGFAVVGGDLIAGQGKTPPRGWALVTGTALAAGAMGLQNATLRRVRGRSVRTTFISGVLTQFTEAFVAFLFWFSDRMRGRGFGRLRRCLRVTTRQPDFAHAALYGGVWCSYLFGALGGGWTPSVLAAPAMILPIAGLGVVALRDLVRPIDPP